MESNLVDYRRPAYPFGLLLLPIITIGGGFWQFGLLLIAVFLLSFKFDKDLQLYRTKIDNFSKFMIWSFLIGLAVACSSYFLNEVYRWLIVLWLIVVTYYYLNVIDKMAKCISNANKPLKRD